VDAKTHTGTGTAHSVGTTHDVVMQMRPSPEQAPAILARGRDVVVTAGAGTGKTRTLVARYLSLLAAGLPLRAILAITFTRKAAREMRNRVRVQIRRYLAQPDLPADERLLWQGHYSALDAARIGTIHSFCGEILRAHPAEAGVDPRFDVLEEGQAAILLGRAVDEALAWAADDEEVVGLFALLGERPLRASLESLLQQQLEVEACYRALPEPLWDAWQAHLQPVLSSFVDEPTVRASLDEMAFLRDDGTLDRAEAAGDLLAAPLRRLLALWDQILAAREEDDWWAILEHLPTLRGAMSTNGQAANWRPADPKANVAELRTRYDAILKDWIGKGLNPLVDRQLAEAMPALRALFQRAAEIYGQLKEVRQALDYDDLEHRALELLRDNDAVRRRWQRDIRAILVDEFQDTNVRQRDLVGLLSEGRGELFIVGDAKQSIYRFRGADVAVFRDERQRIQDQGGVLFSLDTSYRAHRALVQGLNDLLRPVLGEEADPDRPWVEPFAPLAHHREEPGLGLAAPHIELHLTLGPKSGGALHRAADALAGRIAELMEGGIQIVERDGPRPLGYGDFAILCRASGSFGPYEDALERAGMPFLTVAGRGFYGRPEIRDLLNALQALADPVDDLVLAGLLRSPAFALSDVGLYHLCQARGGRAGQSPLWQVLSRPPETLSSLDRDRAERAVRIVADLHGQVGRSSVVDLLKAYLDETGYRAALLEAGQARAARNVSKLLADAHTSGIVGVGEFLEYLSGLRDTGAREGEARAAVEGAVQIMTIHAAKGLEFPVVIIGDVTRGAGRGDSLLVDPRLGTLLPLKDDEGRGSAIHRLAKERADDQVGAESDRLLYVAATRAREKLILSGCAALRHGGTLGKLGGWLGCIAGEDALGLSEVPMAYKEEGAGALRLELAAGDTPVACTIYEPNYTWDLRPSHPEPQAQMAVTLPPPLLAPVTPESDQVDVRLAEESRLPSQRVWRVVPTVRRPRAPAWVVGSLVHEALAAWRFPNGPADRTFQDGEEFLRGDQGFAEALIARRLPGGDEDPGFARWGEARARSYGLADPHQLADAVQSTRRLLLRFHAHALYEEMETAEQRLHEVPYSLAVEGGVESGILDALYRREGTWTIVEFKTDDVRDEAGLNRLLSEENYLAQARRYRVAVERLLGRRPQVRLCLLNYGGEVRLVPVTDDEVG
jgi:ATP-dependent helicase/nuclease subunit A